MKQLLILSLLVALSFSAYTLLDCSGSSTAKVESTIIEEETTFDNAPFVAADASRTFTFYFKFSTWAVSAADAAEGYIFYVSDANDLGFGLGLSAVVATTDNVLTFFADGPLVARRVLAGVAEADDNDDFTNDDFNETSISEWN